MHLAFEKGTEMEAASEKSYNCLAQPNKILFVCSLQKLWKRFGIDQQLSVTRFILNGFSYPQCKFPLLNGHITYSLQFEEELNLSCGLRFNSSVLNIYFRIDRSLKAPIAFHCLQRLPRMANSAINVFTLKFYVRGFSY